MKGNADDVPVVELTARAPCRVCGRPFLLPKGQRAPGGICPRCQPTLDEGLVDGSSGEGSPHVLERDQGERGGDLSPGDYDAEPRDLGHLGLHDVMCSGRCGQLAAGRLYPPGVPLCLDCGEEAVEHFLAWIDDPTHDWWPTDDPFASARHPIPGWRDADRSDSRLS